jgi:hypothetical protein
MSSVCSSRWSAGTLESVTDTSKASAESTRKVAAWISIAFSRRSARIEK